MGRTVRRGELWTGVQVSGHGKSKKGSTRTYQRRWERREGDHHLYPMDCGLPYNLIELGRNATHVDEVSREISRREEDGVAEEGGLGSGSRTALQVPPSLCARCNISASSRRIVIERAPHIRRDQGDVNILSEFDRTATLTVRFAFCALACHSSNLVSIPRLTSRGLFESSQRLVPSRNKRRTTGVGAAFRGRTLIALSGLENTTDANN